MYIISRCERLEEQLNDLTELHQNEILNLKQELASMEEKIAYQSYERARDIQVGDRTKDAPVPTSTCSFHKSFTSVIHYLVLIPVALSLNGILTSSLFHLCPSGVSPGHHEAGSSPEGPRHLLQSSF